MKRRTVLQLAAGLPLLAQAPKQPPKTEWIAWIGTYPRGGSKGIYAYRFVPGEHKFTPLGLSIETPSPSFLAVHPNQRFLYAVNEVDTFEGRTGGTVTAFAIDNDTGHLKQLSRASTRGPGPCHLAIDRNGKWLFAANYNGGSVAAFPVKEDGSVGEATAFAQHSGKSVNPQRQAGPHGHATVLSPDKANEFLAEAWTCSPAALERDSGWKAGYDIVRGAAETAAWYRTAGWL
jgi:6-phosphogluconolactonase